MITLKDYQTRVLDSLRVFLRRCSQTGDPAASFEQAQLDAGAQGVPYLPVTGPGLSRSLPYVCLRVPTGGGKTLLACHSVGLAIREFLHADRAVVLWLVPSTTILDQTVSALRDVRHPYRRALDADLGSVEVLSVEQALRLSRAAADGSSIIIVATIQAFRVEDTAGRKVYEQNSTFLEHFQNIPASRMVDMLRGEDGQATPSLVNILRLRRPVVIVDEAHNARTELSFTTLGNVLPSCILEFTATPARTITPSNVLHRVSAAELKAADMVKLPLRVITRHPGQRDQLLSDAISLRADLERLAKVEAQQTGEYLRPILLLQAERVDACEPLRQQLVVDFAADAKDVKISVGELDELKEAGDLMASESTVRFIITVQKLREGWDCPFAYVLCSLRSTRSATAIEQIVGRILRLPRAQAKQNPDLNCAYAFSLSTTLGEVLAELREALEANGFTKAEAERIIIPAGTPLPLWTPQHQMTLTASDFAKVATVVREQNLGNNIEMDFEASGITIVSPLATEQAEELLYCIDNQDTRAELSTIITAAAETETQRPEPASRTLSGFQLGHDFVVPLLCARENGELFEFESTLLLEHPWRLSAKNASLPDSYNPLVRPAARSGVLDVGIAGEVQTSFTPHDGSDFVATLHQHTFQLSGTSDWSLEGLIAWLDRNIDHRDIPVGESAEFLRKALRGLMASREISDVGLLALDRFRLRDQIELRIEEHRREERKAAFQKWLLPGSELVVTTELSVNFKAMVYEPSWVYSGGFQFNRHYFGPRPGELAETTPVGNVKEEFQCAQFIDSAPFIRYWVRNLPQRRGSFRLQTSTDWFYPDFVCQLNDGRALVVEYKGAHLYTDAEEKRAVGAVWSSRSQGSCLFVMPTDTDFAAITNAVTSGT